MFVQSHLVVVLTGIVSHATDIHGFRTTDNTVVFSNSLHRCDGSSWLVRLFVASLVSRCLASAGTAAAIISTSYLPPGHKSAQLSLYIFLWSLTLVLTCGQLATSVAGLAWLFLAPRLAFARLMSHYTGFLTKVDVARGRSVPYPPYGSHSQQVYHGASHSRYSRSSPT